MPYQKLAREARNCRALASRFQSRPECPFLVKLAETFDELAAAAISPRAAAVLQRTKGFPRRSGPLSG